jgi:DNA adenine methylase
VSVSYDVEEKLTERQNLSSGFGKVDVRKAGREAMRSAECAGQKTEPSNNKAEVVPSVQPFLKWPGGKRWLVPWIVKIINEYKYITYREPFLGGGAIFFALQPKYSVLSDINSDLINTYYQVKQNSASLLESLRSLPVNRATYNYFRESCPASPLQRAVRFLYLNRTAFGGMYRLNKRGEFNVPFGGGERTVAPLWEYDLVTSSAWALRRAKLIAVDFEQALSEAEKGDLVYCDPTYTVTHNNNGFIRYNEKNFSWEDQKRLSRSCHSAAARGALVIVSNACHNDVLDLFAPPRHITVARTSRLCPIVTYRRFVDEYLFIFPPSGMIKDKHYNR